MGIASRPAIHAIGRPGTARRSALATALLAACWCSGAPALAGEPPPVDEPTPAPAPETPEPDPDAIIVPADEQGPPAPAPLDDLDRCPDVPVDSVKLVGCPFSVCGVEERREAFLSLTDVKKGGRIDSAELKLARDRLVKTGFFQSASARCDVGPDGVAVTFLVEPNTFVVDLDIEGNSHFDTSEVRKRVFLRPGRILNVTPGLEEENEDVARQIQSIERLYAREGLEDVTIRVHAKRVSEIGVEVVIEIHEGERERIGEIVARHVQKIEAKPGQLSCPRVERPAIEDLLEVDVGDVLTKRARRDMERRIRRWFQSIGYEKPEVDIRLEGEPLTLYVTVETERCWLIRVWERDAGRDLSSSPEPAFRYRDPVGTSAGPTDGGPPFRDADYEEWRPHLPFGESGSFDIREATRGVDAIRALLDDRGFHFAQVVLEYRDLSRDGGDGPVSGVIGYDLTLNYERRLRGIRFEGNETFGDDVLLEEMDSNVYDFWEPGGQVQVAKIFHDLRKIEQFYTSRGFYEFAFTRHGKIDDEQPSVTFRDEGSWLSWEYRYQDRGFVVRKRKAEMGLYLDVGLKEGRRTEVRSVEVVGNAHLPAEAILAEMKLRAGEPFGTRLLKEDLRHITEIFRARGYHQAAATVTCEAFEPEPPDGLCDVANLKSGEVALLVHVDEGEPAYVGEIFWRGNFDTDSNILTRDLPRPGTPYDRAAIQEATRKMRNLGIFNGVRVDPIGLEEKPPREKVGLVVSVEEATTQFLDLAFSVRSVERRAENAQVREELGYGLGHVLANSDRTTAGIARPFQLAMPELLTVVEAQYLHRNLDGFGWGAEFRAPFEFGLITENLFRLFEGEFDAPDLLSIRPQILFPRLADTDLRLELTARAEFDRVNLRILDRTEYALDVVLAIPLWSKSSLSVEGTLGGIRYVDPADGLMSPFDMNGLTLQVTPWIRWRWDHLDNPLHPTDGWALYAGLGYIRNLTAEKTDQAARQNEFWKWELSGKYVASTRRGYIFAANLRYGGSLYADRYNPLPENERFSLGGSNGLRGFGDHAVGRYDVHGDLLNVDPVTDFGGNVMLNGSFELRIPVARAAGLWLAGFMDGGALASEHRDLNRASFRWSFGGGIRWLIANQIPVRFDVGINPFNERCKANEITGYPKGYDPTLEEVIQNHWYRCAQDSNDRPIMEDAFDFHFHLLYPF